MTQAILLTSSIHQYQNKQILTLKHSDDQDKLSRLTQMNESLSKINERRSSELEELQETILILKGENEEIQANGDKNLVQIQEDAALQLDASRDVVLSLTKEVDSLTRDLNEKSNLISNLEAKVKTSIESPNEHSDSTKVALFKELEKRNILRESQFVQALQQIDVLKTEKNVLSRETEKLQDLLKQINNQKVQVKSEDLSKKILKTHPMSTLKIMLMLS